MDRRCPIQALEPIKVLGLKQGSAYTVMCFVAISRFIGTSIGGMIGWFFAGVLVSYIFEKLTAGQPPNYLVHMVFARIGELGTSKGMRKLLRTLTGGWMAAGLAPPPGLFDHFDP